MSEIYIIQRSKQRPSVEGVRRFSDGPQFYSHTIGTTSFWVAAPWNAAQFASTEEAVHAEGYSAGCKVISLAEAKAALANS